MQKTFCDNCEIDITSGQLRAATLGYRKVVEADVEAKVIISIQRGNNEMADLCVKCFVDIVKWSVEDLEL